MTLPPPQNTQPPASLNNDPRCKVIDQALKRLNFQQDALIEILHTAQETFGYLEPNLLLYIARHLKLPSSWVYGVATFYHFFSLKPPGQHSCTVCIGTACYVKQAAEILTLLQETYHIQPGQTTLDGKLSLDVVRCPGNCASAPILVIDGQVWGQETPQSTLEHIQALISEG